MNNYNSHLSNNTVSKEYYNAHNQVLQKQYQTLRQINKILQSNPQTQYGKDQKIRSLVVVLKRQLDLNKKLDNQVQELTESLKGKNHQLTIQNARCRELEKGALRYQQKMCQFEEREKKMAKQLQVKNQQLALREQLIEKMRKAFQQQKNSMQNQLNYLKNKAISHYCQKIPTIQQKQNLNFIKTIKPKSGKKNNQKKRSQSNIVMRNILAISNQNKNSKTGQSLLKQFNDKKYETERLTEIKKGNYNSIRGGQTIYV